MSQPCEQALVHCFFEALLGKEGSTVWVHQDHDGWGGHVLSGSCPLQEAPESKTQKKQSSLFDGECQESRLHSSYKKLLAAGYGRTVPRPNNEIAYLLPIATVFKVLEIIPPATSEAHYNSASLAQSIKQSAFEKMLARGYRYNLDDLAVDFIPL